MQHEASRYIWQHVACVPSRRLKHESGFIQRPRKRRGKRQINTSMPTVVLSEDGFSDSTLIDMQSHVVY